MISRIYLLSILVLALSFSSCQKDYFDINTDPDAATTVDPEFLLNKSAISYANERMAEIYGTRLYPQMWLGGDYNGWEDEIFNVSPFTTNNFWSISYTDVMTNANKAIELSQSKYTNPKNAVAQLKVWKAFVFYNTTMLWEDIPFSEVGQIESIVAPKYDKQEVVLNGVLTLLDEAIADFSVANPEKLKDPWFSGDISKWIKIANALKLKVLMAMVDADPSKASEIGNLISSGEFMSSNSDNWKFQYIDEAGKKNPTWMIIEKYYGSSQEAWLASNVVLNLLQSNNDPRLDRFYMIGPDAVDYIGIEPYEVISDRIYEISYVSTDIIRGDYPDYMVTYAEQELLIAEAIQRGFASGNADAKLLSGITASMSHFGVDASSTSTYTGAIPSLGSLSSSDALQLIYKEQYLNLFDRVVDPWIQWRRTEYPALNLPEDAAISDIIRRLPYSPTEQSSNANALPNKPLDTKMWFDR
ncbi:MAG TPA: SusD/RagB family nutrient-binding outer membrane lipoprotein [Chitinophagales bacterium]|nr:SusD/RagB family nutrient-binding outer membrane lipoprotein [Chitinophagales bacterium]